MAKKSYYYVLVFTDEGPVYVTQLERNIAYWNKNEKPKDLSKSLANDIANGLSWNAPTAVVVSSPIEIETQPYFYEMGRFKWVNNVTEDF